MRSRDRSLLVDRAISISIYNFLRLLIRLSSHLIQTWCAHKKINYILAYKQYFYLAYIFYDFFFIKNDERKKIRCMLLTDLRYVYRYILQNKGKKFIFQLESINCMFVQVIWCLLSVKRLRVILYFVFYLKNKRNLCCMCMWEVFVWVILLPKL